MTSYGVDKASAAQAEEAAADRFSLILSGAASQADLEEIDGWRRADDANEAAWQRLTSIWSATGAAADAPSIHAMRSAALASGRVERPPRVRWQRYGLALAASLLLAISGFSWAGFEGLLPWQDRGTLLAGKGSGGWSRGERTRVGEIRSFRLGDGSTVTLNTDSDLQTALSPAVRAVRLSRGEAFFKVAIDADRPFAVEAGPLVVTALGTQFSVRNMSDAVVVTLVEGRVRVTTADRQKEQILTPGMQLVAAGPAFRSTTIDAERAVSWTSGLLDFRQARLDAVVAEMNRYSSRKIVLADPVLAARPVSGLFPTDNQDRFIDMLVASEKIRVKRRTASSVELGTP